jgi:hypothetical protein
MTLARLLAEESGMAKETDRIQSGILGDINPVPSAKDHISGSGDGIGDADDSMDNGSRRNHPEHSGEVGGTRNYRQGTGAIGGDIGNRPE